ncbi:MAG: septum formation protein Maf [Lachnospiraceae bacterium]|nr:septum formation protein Maf [Lachnospiraceae bacterium]
MKIILASASPRRVEILNRHGIEPVILPQDTDESLPEGIGMTEAVEMLSSAKARACYDAVKDDPAYEGFVILGADTIVWKDEIMGKPEDKADAWRMLDRIRGTNHYVITGVCLIDVNSGSETAMNDVTAVHCVNYSDDDIDDYISGEEPYDKAGAYAIQGYFGRYIDHIDGDYENVMGLPFHIIEDELKKYM